jgi:hypothetical protein
MDTFEARTVAGDPSLGGRFMAAAHVEWTPRAPIGADHLATNPDDPWYDTVRVSAGLGALARVRGDGFTGRTDLSTNLQLQWRRYAGIAELILTQDADVTVAAAAEASVFVATRLALFTRADLDGSRQLWTAGGGATWLVTADRRNKLALYGFARRGLEDAAPRDGIIVLLQASL